MAVVHIPRIRGNFGGVVIPRALFDGANHGLGVFCGNSHPDPSAVERDTRRLARGIGSAYAGKLNLPGGTLFALEMPADPARLFMQLGLTTAEVRDQVNAVNLSDPREEDVVNRWRNFQQLNHRFLDQATEAERAAFDMRSVELGENAVGGLVIETPFGRSFNSQGVTHAEWQIAKDGLRKVQGGRASHFLRAFDMADWSYLARGLVGKLHRFPEQPIGTRDLQRLMELGKTTDGPALNMDTLRELIEEQFALVRAQNAVSGRDFAEAVSTGFPPHDTRDRTATRVIKGQYSTPPAVGEVAAEFLKPNGRTIYEPTIGNGVLAAASYGAGGLVYGVEIDPARHGRVGEALPDARVILGDSTKPAEVAGIKGITDPQGRFDAVLANPPYADLLEDLGPVRFDQFDFSLPAGKLDTHIAANAIQRLKPGGNAVLVMPGNMMKPAEFGVESRRFQVMLNAAFEKVNSVVLDASLYRNMGSNFPVIVHFCENRRPDGQSLDIASAAALVPERLEVVGTFGAFYERASAIIQESKIEALPLDVADHNRSLFLGSANPAQEADSEQPQPAPGEEEVPQQIIEDEPQPAPDDVEDAPDYEEEPAPEVGPPAQEPGALIAGEEGAIGSPDSGPSGTSGNSGRGRADPIERPEGNRPRIPQRTGESDDLAVPETDGPIHAPTGADDLQPPKRMALRDWFVDDFAPDKFTVPYSPRSQKGQTLAVIERTMANETYAALRRIEEAVGKTVDEYVAERMGIPLEEFMSDRVLFYPEQVDSLALSFHRRETGRATIIGDQMGVGKGIQLAAHTYASIEVEDRPVLFMTNRANLFSDLCVRDWKNASGKRFLDRVNVGAVRPFIFNADGSLRESEKVVFSTTAEERKEAQVSKELGDKNLVMMTYSQVQTASGAWRHQALKNWITANARDGKAPVILLDEAHKAAGDESRTGYVIQDLLAHAQAHSAEIVFSSATSLKSGRNLPVYTPALPDTGLSNTELLLAIEKMPLAMQEVLASEMAKDGALIERKMSDAGVDRDLVVLADVDPERMENTRSSVDRVSGLLRELQDMAPVFAEAAKLQARKALGGTLMAGSLDKVRAETTSVASQLDSFSRYLMGAVKGQFVGELLQDAVARGNKPSVVLEYTADSVSEFVIGAKLGLLSSNSDGVVVDGHPHIGDVLKRFAHKALTFKASDGLGNSGEMRLEGFDGWLDGYISRVDDAAVEDLRVNVFDRAREAAEALGMTFEDITGRKYEFRTGDDGLVRAFMREKPITADAVSRYNNGQTDILGLNSGSATGVSAQASPAHGNDVRRREMIKLAFQREITDERQVEGRVHRAGQIVPPRYTIPVTGFAPDDRIANLFNRANRSLTSATSATRENRTNAEHAVDILNPVGERAAKMVLMKSPHIAETLDIDAEKGTDVARKLLGRSVMLPLADQSAILSEVDSMFRVISDKMTAEGTNPLRLQFYDWSGKVETVEDLVPATPGARGIAAEPLRLNKIVYEEKVESLSAKTVIGNIVDNTRQRDVPFANMHKLWGYHHLLTTQRHLNFDHSLFHSVTGRVAENGRHIWPEPLPTELTSRLMGKFHAEIRDRQRKLGRAINNDEFRAISEELATNDLLSDRARRYEVAFTNYADEVKQKTGAELKASSVAMGLRAIYNRSVQLNWLNKTLPEIEPGRLVAIDRRALTQIEGGMWGNAYEKGGIEDGLIPAIITSARFADDSPFAESKMKLSVFVPGSRYVERLTLSSLHSGMELSGVEHQSPIKPFEDFIELVRRVDYPSAQKKAVLDVMTSIMGEEGHSKFQDKLEEIRGEYYPLNRVAEVLTEGRVENKAGVQMFQAITESLPQLTRRQSRMTLEGNLFIGMSTVSNSLANATSGEKIVYTDEHGTHRNAILLNNKSTAQLVESVKRKIAKRSVNHAGLNSEEAISKYLLLTNAIEFGTNFFSDNSREIVMETLADFYPKSYVADPDQFAEVMASIRSKVEPQSGTFPSSVMAGGDVWRWATDLAQKAASATDKPRGYVEGMGSPAHLRVNVEEDKNSLGFHEATLHTTYSTHSLNAAISDIDRSTALALSLGRDHIALVLHKDHPAFSGPDGRFLEQNMGQSLSGGKLKSGLLAGSFTLSDAGQRSAVARALLQTGGGKPEILIGGISKALQAGLTKDAEMRATAALKAELSQELENKQISEPDHTPDLTEKAPASIYRGGYDGP